MINIATQVFCLFSVDISLCLLCSSSPHWTMMDWWEVAGGVLSWWVTGGGVGEVWEAGLTLPSSAVILTRAEWSDSLYTDYAVITWQTTVVTIITHQTIYQVTQDLTDVFLNLPRPHFSKNKISPSFNSLKWLMMEMWGNCYHISLLNNNPSDFIIQDWFISSDTLVNVWSDMMTLTGQA